MFPEHRFELVSAFGRARPWKHRFKCWHNIWKPHHRYIPFAPSRNGDSVLDQPLEPGPAAVCSNLPQPLLLCLDDKTLDGSPTGNASHDFFGPPGLFSTTRNDSRTLRTTMSSYPTPSNSSHASQVLAAALGTPTPTPPRLPAPCTTTLITDPSHSVSGSSAARTVPVYHLYGLDYGTDTTSDTGSIRLPSEDSQYECIFPLKLPLKTMWRPLIPASECRVRLDTEGDGSNGIVPKVSLRSCNKVLSLK